MASRAGQLPYGVGRMTTGWYLLVALLVVLVAVGVYAYSVQLTQGEYVTGLRDIGTMGGAPWGLYVAFIVYFVGVSFAGITIAAVIRLLGLRHLRPVARMAELLTVVALILGAFSVILDVGQPLRAVVNLFRYARPQSPFFGTFTLVISGYLFASVVYLYLGGRRDAAVLAQTPGRLQWFYRLWAAGYRDTPPERERRRRASFWLAVSILPLLVTAHSTLGFVFGLQVGRPGWFSALQAPGFVTLAGVSGVGMLIIVAALLRQVLSAEDELGADIFKWLGNILMVLTVAYLYFMLVDWLTSIYAAQHHEVRVTAALLSGQYAWIFWSVVATLGMAASILFWPYVPLPAPVRLPALVPRLVRAAGVAALVIGVVALIQFVPVARQVGLVVSPEVVRWVPWVLIALLAFAAVFSLPELRRNAISRAVVAGVLVNVAAVGKRFLVVVPSQTHGSLLPYPVGSYSPTWVEYSVVIGLFALGTLLYVLFMKVFPIMRLPKPAEEGV